MYFSSIKNGKTSFCGAIYDHLKCKKWAVSLLKYFIMCSDKLFRFIFLFWVWICWVPLLCSVLMLSVIIMQCSHAECHYYAVFILLSVIIMQCSYAEYHYYAVLLCWVSWLCNVLMLSVIMPPSTDSHLTEGSFYCHFV